MNDDNPTRGGEYVAAWVHAFQVFLGYPKSLVLEWARHYEDDLTEDDSFFYHEPPMYYVALYLCHRAFYQA